MAYQNPCITFQLKLKKLSINAHQTADQNKYLSVGLEGPGTHLGATHIRQLAAKQLLSVIFFRLFSQFSSCIDGKITKF